MSDLAITQCETLAMAMLLLRRVSAEAASRALQERCGVALPAPGRLTANGALTLLWSGPDRFLAVRDGSVPVAPELAPALQGLAHVVEASASRAVLQVAGAAAMEALGRLLPLDLHPRVFTPGSVALTTASHIAVQVWRPGADPLFRLACGTSFAASFRHQVALACRPG